MLTLSRRSILKLGATALGVLGSAPALGAESQAPVGASGLRFEIYRDTRRRFRWRLKAANGRVIATSGEGYAAKADCRNGIDRIREGAATATVEDLS